MTAVANLPQHFRPTWGSSPAQGGIASMNPDEVTRMFMPRKSAQRANSSSSVNSNSSSGTSTTTITQPPAQANGTLMSATGDGGGWSAAAARKKNQRSGPWPPNKSDPISGVTTARPQSIVATNGISAASSISSIHQPQAVVPSQQALQSTTQQNGGRQIAQGGDALPALYLLSMNGTFERKTISVPYYPDVLRIGRQTNIKTVPSATNGYFDSKVLSRQHAEIWAERNGKVWIRDVRSSNGTFVNGARLSAENRDSEPHELQSQDHLELGIDIVSEDQKTIVHHKVAAKVEHAGFLGASSNVLDMNFGDLDPASGTMMVPSPNGIPIRGRSSSQGSATSNGRGGPPGSAAGNNVVTGHQRPMNFWLTPVTTEQIVKRLTLEMRSAKIQMADLGRTEHFFDTLIMGNALGGTDGYGENGKMPQVNGILPSSKPDNKTRFMDPPAPPPQQPLPEKPDASKGHGSNSPLPSLKRTNTERPRSIPNISPTKADNRSDQLSSLMEALFQAKKEIDTQNSRVRDLEGLLLKEREARENAEIHAKRLETESASKHDATSREEITPSSVHEDAGKIDEKGEAGLFIDAKRTMTAEMVEASTTRLQEKLDSMMSEMKDMRFLMESYRQRAEIAESERDADRKTLAEMVLKIRADGVARRSSSTERARSPSNTAPTNVVSEEDAVNPSANLLTTSDTRGDSRSLLAMSQNPLAVALSQPPGSQSQLMYHSTPYASMLGVVLIGMGLMAYINGWQKGER